MIRSFFFLWFDVFDGRDLMAWYGMSGMRCATDDTTQLITYYVIIVQQTVPGTPVRIIVCMSHGVLIHPTMLERDL
jgi:hypothetical protein